MMEDVLNDESENISVSQLLDLPHNSCIKNETRVREAEGILKIEVPDNVRKIVIVKAQVHGVMTCIPPLFFLQFFFIHFSSSIMPWSNPCRALSSKRLGCYVRNVWNIEPMKK
jgi:hypothetical protein